MNKSAPYFVLALVFVAAAISSQGFRNSDPLKLAVGYTLFGLTMGFNICRIMFKL